MTQAPHHRKTRRIPRFRLASVLLVLLACGVTAAAALALGESITLGSASSRAVFVIAVLLLPIVALIVANGFYFATQWSRRHHERS